MSAIIQIDQDNESILLFKTKEEWDEFRHSFAYRRKYWKGRKYMSTAQHGPEKFPCIAVWAGFVRNRDSHDEEIYAYIYNFELKE